MHLNHHMVFIHGVLVVIMMIYCLQYNQVGYVVLMGHFSDYRSQGMNFVVVIGLTTVAEAIQRQLPVSVSSILSIECKLAYINHYPITLNDGSLTTAYVERLKHIIVLIEHNDC